MNILKNIPEHIYYFIAFIIIAIFTLTQGYAAIVTNDDWMLYNLLIATDVYGTLLMSYPLSYIISNLYDIFPSIQWYSLLLSSIIIFYSYLASIYIANKKTYFTKISIFLFFILSIFYLWLHISLTSLTIATLIVSLSFVRNSLLYTLLFLLFASLLRSSVMISFLPFWLIGFLIIKEKLNFSKKEIYLFLITILLIGANLFTTKIDKDYSQWLNFNTARALTSDLNTVDTNNMLTKEEQFLLYSGHIQNDELLPLEKVINANSGFSNIVIKQLVDFDYFTFTDYRLSEWLYLFLIASLLLMYQNRKKYKVILIPLFAIGLLTLIAIRDVDRVTIPLFVMWAFIITESFRNNKIINSIFLLTFTTLFAYYASSGLTYRHFKENQQLKQEARKLIGDTGVSCEVSLVFPIPYSIELLHIMQNNFLFYEDNWLKINNKEILPSNWISKHPYFYQAHNISHKNHKRKFNNYYNSIIDENTGFLGAKELTKTKEALYILDIYDKYYLNDRPECKHNVYIIAQSEHYTITQIRVQCKPIVAPDKE